MRLNEILTESQELEEGPLGAIGRGLAKGVGGVAKGVGMIGGIAGGVKKAYQKGKATSTATIAGDVPDAEQDPAVKKAYDDEYAKVTAPKKAPAASGQAAPQQAAASGYKQAQQSISTLKPGEKKRLLAMLQKELGGGAPPTAPAQQLASTRRKPVRVTGKAAAQPAMQTQSKVNSGKVVAEGFTLFRQK
jgi:hypothetical protein